MHLIGYYGLTLIIIIIIIIYIFSAKGGLWGARVGVLQVCPRVQEGDDTKKNPPWDRFDQTLGRTRAEFETDFPIM